MFKRWNLDRDTHDRQTKQQVRRVAYFCEASKPPTKSITHSHSSVGIHGGMRDWGIAEERK